MPDPIASPEATADTRSCLRWELMVCMAFLGEARHVNAGAVHESFHVARGHMGMASLDFLLNRLNIERSVRTIADRNMAFIRKAAHSLSEESNLLPHRTSTGSACSQDIL